MSVRSAPQKHSGENAAAVRETAETRCRKQNDLRYAIAPRPHHDIVGLILFRA